jgi:FkbH-like protein
VKLREALSIQAKPEPSGAPFEVFLATGITPLHLVPFLKAHLRLALPSRAIRIDSGLFGDLAGNIEGLAGKDHAYVVVLIEWGDLDPRLSMRSAGAWTSNEIPMMLDTVRVSLARLETAIQALPVSTRLVVSLPQLPLPPIAPNGPWDASLLELKLHVLTTAFAEKVSLGGHCLLSAEELDRISAPAGRYDASSDLKTGHPYTLSHADALASLLTRHISPPKRKKGLITDLDNTLWSGILGEVGMENITWSHEAHSHIHAIYQVFLDSLAASGVLLGAATKNDATLVEEALRRRDLRMDASKLFPVEAHWGPKSESVSRIIQAWNVGPDSVVFVDDSPMELAEVKATHLEMECLLFEPAAEKLWSLLHELRSLFAKARIEEEDLIRLQSIRQSVVFNAESARSTSEEVLRTAGAKIQFSFQPCSVDSRSFELINKTNQFNLNGVRLSQDEWSARLSQPGAFLMTSNYEDRFGPLGKIAVAVGSVNGSRARVDSWVMSCRAFSRRVEHACLKAIFEALKVSEVILAFRVTVRNGPLREFLSSVGLEPNTGDLVLTTEQFAALCPPLHHESKLVEPRDSAH